MPCSQCRLELRWDCACFFPEDGGKMDVDLIIKVAGVGMIVAVVCLVLTRAGKEDQANLVSLAGVVLILLFLVGKVGELITALREVFGL